MAEEITSNSYEEARKQQLLKNKKRFEELGILKITKSLTDLSKSEKKSKQREVKLKIRNSSITELRRSTRERNPVKSYHDDVDIGLPPVRRSRSSASWASYLARPLVEVKIASYERRVQAMKSAEKLQSNLQSECPSFVKSMVRSHVYSCFRLGLPMSFCKKHLPKSIVSMVLEDEDCNEYEALFISERTGLSGGWRAFALEHKLDDGDALVFELVEPKRFKIHIVKALDFMAEIKSNSYKEARKQQLLENKKRFEELGILKITKSLTDLSKSEKKSKQREVKLKIRNAPITEPRRSTRKRNPVKSYYDDVDIGLPPVRRSSYLARPLEEVKIASYERRVQALKSAEKLQSNLQSECPSFVKSMFQSHVYFCFWLGLPMSFCKKHLPKSTVSMVLEDEDGNEYEAVFISEKTGLGGGWRAFALEHKLDDGDALVFELVEPKRFKIHIVKASHYGSLDDDDDDVEEEEPKRLQREDLRSAK